MKKRAGAALLAALLLLAGGLPVQASAGSQYAPDVTNEVPAKQQMLEALDLLRDHGLSVIGITDRILGTGVLEKSEEKTGDSLAQSLQEAAGAAGSDAADAAAKVGESAVSEAQQAAEKTTQSFFDALREKITSFFESLFVSPQ